MFEMLGLFEEALIQYDEIDALLTQLVINSNFGGMCKGWFTQYNFVAYNMLTTSLQHELFCVL